ncbi:MAG: histidinol dehydrogenase [Planctomycetales bacterium]|nr:histidinol dehydrogenase [Planctomycetales bacterium]
MMQITRIDTRNTDPTSSLAALRQKLSPRGDIVTPAARQKTIEVFGEALTPQQVVERICRDVQTRGVTAVLEYSRRIDSADLRPDQLRVSAEELVSAHAAASPEFLAAVRRIAQRVANFQTAILHRNVELRPSKGVVLRQRYVALRRAGICVPGGMAAYPSTVLMTAIPAQAAGVSELAVVAPPTPNGAYNRELLATCHELGIREVYRVGGAQAVAAMAYGIDQLPAVDKIVGPGNLFVALAKKHVYGDVDIDSIAGPSEVIVIADESTRPDFAAADLLAQAEHGPGSSVLITWDEALLDAIEVELNRQLTQLSRREITEHSLREFGAFVLARDADEACRITDLLAPEHLHIAVANAAEFAAKIRNAGATFLGNFSPVALGDYAAGPSHVLPTGGTARWASGLSSNDFLRSGSVIEYDETALRGVAEDIRQLADKEQLTAHRASVDIRVQ